MPEHSRAQYGSFLSAVLATEDGNKPLSHQPLASAVVPAVSIDDASHLVEPIEAPRGWAGGDTIAAVVGQHYRGRVIAGGAGLWFMPQPTGNLSTILRYSPTNAGRLSTPYDYSIIDGLGGSGEFIGAAGDAVLDGTSFSADTGGTTAAPRAAVSLRPGGTPYLNRYANGWFFLPRGSQLDMVSVLANQAVTMAIAFLEVPRRRRLG